jgi:hypothetical protein
MMRNCYDSVIAKGKCGADTQLPYYAGDGKASQNSFKLNKWMRAGPSEMKILQTSSLLSPFKLKLCRHQCRGVMP